jgi:acyl-CoA synthetase (NDP forming)
MQWLVSNGIPAYGAPDVTINAMAALYEYHRMKADIASDKAAKPAAKGDIGACLKIIQKARQDGRDSLTEIEAKQVFAAYGLPVTQTLLAKSEDEAVALAKQVGFPIVMKIVSPDILHKSDAGGVKVNIQDEQGVRETYHTILAKSKAYKADANIHGIAIQEMAAWGTEVILGSVNDPSFGPTMMFGLGGIFVEVLKDVTFRVAPVGANQAVRMLDEIRGAPILAGVRGEKPRDRKAMADTIARYSQMIIDLKDEISETDANPVLLYEEGQGLRVVDARIILKKK